MESSQSRFYNKVFYVYLLDEIALLIQFLYDVGSMTAVEITIVVILVVTLAFAPSCDAQYRRRRGLCTPRNCQVSHWSSWNPCSVNQCGQQGSQSRSRTVVSSLGCEGDQCPNLYETQQCNGSKPINCQVSLCILWSGCSADKCGQQGTENRYWKYFIACLIDFGLQL